MLKRLTLVFALAALSAAAQTKPSNSNSAALPANDPRLAKAESYLRVLFAWGPEYQIKLGPATPASIPGLYEVPVHVTHQGRSETGTVYVSKDGRYMFRGEIRDMSADPFAANRAKLRLHLSDAPSIGPADAKITVVEFSDFECPHCRELYSILKNVEPEFPQVRFVFKNFPLTEIHPWAMTAAIAGRCVFRTSNDAFWKFQSQVFDSQDIITADNAWDQMTGFAATEGISPNDLHSCLADPAIKGRVEADLAEGKSLDVESTPTIFVNGRPLVGPDQPTLEQALHFSQSKHNMY